MATQHGLVLRRQAVEAGLAPRQIDQLVRQGTWVAVRRGVYADSEMWQALDTFTGQPRLRARAASLNMLTPHVMSHDSAALELGLAVLRPSRPLVHVTRFGVLGSRTEFGVKHHKAPFRSDQLVEVDGLWVLDHARTAADIAREHGTVAGVVAVDSARRAGVTVSQLWDAVDPMRCWPYVTHPRAAIELSDPGSDSVGESLGRMLIEELGLGEIETQFGLRDGEREAWCDMRVGRHVFEFDGRLKYRTAEQGGVADRPADEVLWREKQRQDWVCGFKLGMSRMVWADLWPPLRERTKRRLVREYRDTESRFGNSIEDLAPYIVRRRDR